MESLRGIPQDQRDEFVAKLTRPELQKLAKEAGLKVSGVGLWSLGLLFPSFETILTGLLQINQHFGPTYVSGIVSQANVKSSILVASLLEKLASEDVTAETEETDFTLAANESLPVDSGEGVTGGAQESDTVIEPKSSPLPEGPPSGHALDDMHRKQPSPLVTSTGHGNNTNTPSGVQAAPYQTQSAIGSAKVVEKTEPQPEGFDCKKLEMEAPLPSAPAADSLLPVAEETPDFEECMSQTLQNAVANLDPSRSTSLIDCLGPVSFLEDQHIEHISISPFLDKHCLKARPSPWIHERPPVAPSEDLDAVIAAADTAFADCCADTDFVDMALRDPSEADLEDVSASKGDDVSAQANEKFARTAEVLTSIDAVPAPENLAPSNLFEPRTAAEDGRQIVDDQASGPGPSEALPPVQATNASSHVPLESPFAMLCNGRDSQNGAIMQTTANAQNKSLTCEGPGYKESGVDSQNASVASRDLDVPAQTQGVSDLRSYSRGMPISGWLPWSRLTLELSSKLCKAS
jgi:hypothetical protein